MVNVGQVVSANKKARILVVDDSAIIRSLVGDLFKAEGFEVVSARNGREALEIASTSRFDAAILDVNMPVMDGISVLKEFVRMGIPSVMFSSLTTEASKVTIEALEIGALDFVPKPGPLVLDIRDIKRELLMKVKVAILSKRMPSIRRAFQRRIPCHEMKRGALANKVVLIAASTGGPSMVKSVLHDLPKRLGAAVLIVQHMPPLFTKSFAENLASFSSIPVKEAEHGDPIYEDNAYVAPGDYHMEVSANSRIILHKGEKVNFVRPSADPLFFSAAMYFCPSVVGVILSGMGSDGAQGALAVRRRGGHIIVQDESTSVVYGMPKAAIEVGAAEEVLSIESIPAKIVELIND